MNDKRPGRGWYSKAEICEFHGIAEQTFERTYRPLVPDEAVQTDGRRVWFFGPTYLQMYGEYKARMAVEGSGGSSGADREQEKRIQRANADMLEFKRDAMLKRLVPREELEPELMAGAAELNRGIGMLERQHGRDAADIMIEIVRDLAVRWARLFDGRNGNKGTPPPDGGAGNPQARP